MTTIARVYFLDALTGLEMTEHPLNGSPFVASSTSEITLSNGRKVTRADFDRDVKQRRWFGPACEFNDTVALA